MKILEFLTENKVLFLDGGMGTEIEKRKCSPDKMVNFEHPDVIEEIQREYVSAGSDCLISNTLTFNKVYDLSHGGNGDIATANQKGIEIARRAIGETGFVLGDMTTTGQMLEPYGDMTEEIAYDSFKDQAKALSESGIDGFLIETMFDLNETVCAVKACKEVNPNIPVFASITYSTLMNGGRTIMGNSAAQCAQELVDAGADVIGANCGDLLPEELVNIIKTYKETVSVPIMVQPNAGKPEMIDGKPVFKLSPSDFASGTLKCYEAGATILGGCCGTTPEHIKALKDGWKSAKYQ